MASAVLPGLSGSIVSRNSGRFDHLKANFLIEKFNY